jgi:hypothetical protein
VRDFCGEAAGPSLLELQDFLDRPTREAHLRAAWEARDALAEKYRSSQPASVHQAQSAFDQLDPLLGMARS